MAAFDDELLQSAEDDARCIEYIKAYLPQELKERFDDELLEYFLDVIYEYYTESGILDATPDSEGFIDIDLEKLAEYMAKQAKKDNMGTFDPDELLLIAQAEGDYADSIEEE